MIYMTHAEKAKVLFKSGYSCSQSVFLAFNDMINMEETTALKLSSSFGGGFGRMREVCGAVSGMCMALGAICGYDDPKDRNAKTAHYERVQREISQRCAEKIQRGNRIVYL